MGYLIFVHELSKTQRVKLWKPKVFCKLLVNHEIYLGQTNILTQTSFITKRKRIHNMAEKYCANFNHQGCCICAFIISNTWPGLVFVAFLLSTLLQNSEAFWPCKKIILDDQSSGFSLANTMANLKSVLSIGNGRTRDLVLGRLAEWNTICTDLSGFIIWAVSCLTPEVSKASESLKSCNRVYRFFLDSVLLKPR